MSQVLYALVVLQGTTLNLSPGYTSVASAHSNTKDHTLVASRTTRTSARGRHSLNFRRAGSGRSGRLPARTSVSDTSVRLRTVSPPLAGSWLCPSLVTLPALPQCPHPRGRQR